MEKTYYIAKSEYADQIYGSECPVCLSAYAIRQLADGWEMSVEDLMEQFEEASAAEIAEYGTADEV